MEENLDTSLGSRANACMRGFEAVRKALDSVATLEDKISYQAALTDSNGRFNIFCGNLGARQVGKNSLEFRLKDAPRIRLRITRLLIDLQKLLYEGMSHVVPSNMFISPTLLGELPSFQKFVSFSRGASHA